MVYWFNNSTYTCSECGNTFTLNLDKYEGYYILHCPYCGNNYYFELLTTEDQT